MGLLVTLYLISSNVYNSVNAPEKRGFSYIESWMIGTQGMILLALIEYGIVLGWKKYCSNTSKVISPKRKIAFHDKISIDDKIKRIDLVALVISSIFFACFNIYYWSLV